MTVYEFAKKCMNDPEYNRGGIVKNERKYLDAVGFKYTVENGCITDTGEDLHKFYEAMSMIQALNEKYLRQSKA